MHQNVSSFIIAPFTKNEAIIVQLLFTYAFFEYILYGGLKEFHIADKLGPTVLYLLEPSSLIAMTIALYYLLFLVFVAAGMYNPQKEIKKIIPLTMVGIVSLLSIMYASDSVRIAAPKDFYDSVLYCVGLITLLVSAVRLIVIMSTLGKRYDSWGKLDDNEIVSKMQISFMSFPKYIVLALCSVTLYFLLHPPFAHSLSKQLPLLLPTFLQSYFYMMIVLSLYEKLTIRKLTTK